MCTVAPSRAASGQKRRRSNALKHTPRTVKDDAHHIFVIVGGTWSQGRVDTFCQAGHESIYVECIPKAFHLCLRQRTEENINALAPFLNLSLFVNLGPRKVWNHLRLATHQTILGPILNRICPCKDQGTVARSAAWLQMIIFPNVSRVCHIDTTILLLPIES